jgi:hypothetical protein
MASAPGFYNWDSSRKQLQNVAEISGMSHGLQVIIPELSFSWEKHMVLNSPLKKFVQFGRISWILLSSLPPWDLVDLAICAGK